MTAIAGHKRRPPSARPGDGSHAQLVGSSPRACPHRNPLTIALRTTARLRRKLSASALARNDPTLLTKTDPAPLVNRYGLPAGKSYFCPRARGDISFLRNTGRGGGIAWGSGMDLQTERLTRLRRGCWNTKPHAFGVDDNAAHSCPWANSCSKSCSQCGSTLTEQKWVTFA